MGSIIDPDANEQINLDRPSSVNLNEEKRVQKPYDIEVIEVSNIALAIKNKQHTVNVQLSLRCQNLPVKAFGSTDSMIVVLKNDDYSGGGSKNFLEIGRTQVIINQLNPKFIKTFIFPYNEQKKQEIQFKIYHMLKPNSDDLSHQKLIGTSRSNLDQIVDIQNTKLQVDLVSKVKSKTVLTVNCVEYDGGNSKYQIGIQLINFTLRSEVYFIIEALKFGEWIPIIKSESKKPSKFREIFVPFNKFQGQQNSGIRIKVFDLKEQEIGSTKQFSCSDFNTQEKAPIYRVYNNGFAVGSVQIYKWKKIIRDSFMSYIVGGAQLRLLIAIDYTNSNTKRGSSLHSLNSEEQNPYINAIKQIGGVLQIFCIENQIALYGFGAKLPPYFKSVSQCFALNGNYFNPNVEGGMQEIIRLYKDNLKKIKMHGPTKLSEILDLAIKYANEEDSLQIKSLTYYILMVVTDGVINDYEDTVDKIVTASTMPLSIIFVGVGEGGEEDDEKHNFKLLQSLDADTIKLKSSKTDKVCERDIVDFIKLDDFVGENNKLALARETFAEIPNQFIDYMSSKNIKPAKQKKNLKAAKAQFISEKIKSITGKAHPFISSFLEKQKKEMKKKLINLGFNKNSDLFQKMNIAMNDLSYFIQVNSEAKQVMGELLNTWTEKVDIKQSKDLEGYLEKKENQNKKKTLQKLEKIEANKFGRKLKRERKKEEPKKQEQKQLIHPCLKCNKNEIQVLHMQCGHSSVCKDCSNQRCFVCYHINKQVKIINFNELSSS